MKQDKTEKIIEIISLFAMLATIALQIFSEVLSPLDIFLSSTHVLFFGITTIFFLILLLISKKKIIYKIIIFIVYLLIYYIGLVVLTNISLKKEYPKSLEEDINLISDYYKYNYSENLTADSFIEEKIFNIDRVAKGKVIEYDISILPDFKLNLLPSIYAFYDENNNFIKSVITTKQEKIDAIAKETFNIKEDEEQKILNIYKEVIQKQKYILKDQNNDSNNILSIYETNNYYVIYGNIYTSKENIFKKYLKTECELDDVLTEAKELIENQKFIVEIEKNVE